MLGGLAFAKDGLFIAKHEGDTLHMMQIVFRMADGQWPHLDFMTPIGALAFAPIAAFVKLGFGIGHAVIYAQIVMALVLIPFVWWIGISRLSIGIAYLFCLFVMVLVLALIHGEAQQSLSVSMHYNRWAWAFAFVAISLSVIPQHHYKNATIDGIIIGVALAALAMIKVTYFVAFVVPVLLGLALHRSYRSIFFALVTGLMIALVITAFAGSGYWLAYLRDLLAVAQSEVRPQPGESFQAIVVAPAYLGSSILVIFSVVLLRQAKEQVGGLLLLLLAPGFAYVTYQNFGNDPQWLLLLAVLLFALRPAADVVSGRGWNMRLMLNMAGAAAIAFSSPSFLNLAFSPFRHLAAVNKDYAPLLPRSTQHVDLLTAKIRAYRVDATVAMNDPETGLDFDADLTGRKELVELLGEQLPECTLAMGIPAWINAIVKDLERSGLAEGKRLFAADLISSHWLYGSLLPLIGGAPWYYGGLPGFESADYLLVPLCPISTEVRKQILEIIAERNDTTLNEIRRTPLYILLEKS
ncbi:hypothetical protein ACFFUT_01965 [Pseudohalocynthiibacter aestuariivivens]|uniref:DUF2029 domain-containing protein n=1 Tax=Pseudohalocynthiibacter aestuariivivens TaxID=1591409 RepID=A0ABV5JAV5_9RHOB|nr:MULTISPECIES: hypothetical protein [Pseudohalocynthiibacter]MBS9715895.1 hypothetical protein [Pseudohalocynthiibacter aestuariivivens]MCK0101508.1 hypothetical protein [Pseudohalocynthiibacter sp. F2068]